MEIFMLASGVFDASEYAILFHVQTRKILQLQNQNTFLNGLAVPNKYRMLPERLNMRFCRNSLNVLDCWALSLKRSVSGCRHLDTAFPKNPKLKKKRD